MKQLLIFILVLCSSVTLAQSSAEVVLKNLQKKVNSTGKYEVDINIKIDVKFIKIKNRTGKMFFYPPDSIRFKIDGFAFLPKKGFNSQLTSLTSQNVTALSMGQEKVNGILCEVIKVIPLDINSEIVLAQIWVDKTKNRMMKMTTITKSQGSSSTDFEYAVQNKYDLPSKMTISFEIKNQKLPSSFTGDFDQIDEQVIPESDNGSVTISYSNFIFR
jgi:outer membrane lipoprotein-sorting protein